jgi:hypothetical protein
MRPTERGGGGQVHRWASICRRVCRRRIGNGPAASVVLQRAENDMDPRDFQTSRFGRLMVFLVVTFVVTLLVGVAEPTSTNPTTPAAPLPPAGPVR